MKKEACFQQRLIELEAILVAITRSQALIEFAMDGTILSANQKFLDVVGYQLEQVVGRHHSMFVEPHMWNDPSYTNFWQALRAGEYKSAEFKRIGNEGREVWLQATYNPIFDTSGKPWKVVKFATDVTKLKLVTADHAGQINAIGKSQAVITFDLDGIVTSLNDKFLASLGYTAAEVIGHHHRMFVTRDQGDSSEYLEFWARLRRGEFITGEFKRVGKHGREIWLQASYNPIFDMNGRPFKVVKYASDITAEKTRSADFSGQINAIAMSQAVIAFDLDGVILSANEKFLSAIGYEEDEVVGQHHSMFVSAEERQSREYRAFWLRLKSGEYYAGEFKRIGKDGREIWLQATYNPIKDVDGKPFKVVKYASDITEEVLRREKFNILSLVADETDNSVVITDKNRKIIFVNRGFERLTGFTMGEVVGRSPGQILQGPNTDRETVNRVRARLAAGEPFYEEILNYDKAKNPYWISLAINPVRGHLAPSNNSYRYKRMSRRPSKPPWSSTPN